MAATALDHIGFGACAGFRVLLRLCLTVDASAFAMKQIFDQRAPLSTLWIKVRKRWHPPFAGLQNGADLSGSHPRPEFCQGRSFGRRSRKIRTMTCGAL